MVSWDEPTGLRTLSVCTEYSTRDPGPDVLTVVCLNLGPLLFWLGEFVRNCNFGWENLSD